MIQHSTTVETSSLAEADTAYFQNKFRHLSGDLELPLEDKLPGKYEFIEYRIGSDLSGAFVLYYFHDEVVFASLLLSGSDNVAETELMQVFKFLLLDSDDDEEPTEEEIERVLSSDEFDFDAIQDRPVVLQIELSDDDDATDQVKHIAEMDLSLATAFFGLDRVQTQ